MGERLGGGAEQPGEGAFGLLVRSFRDDFAMGWHDAFEGPGQHAFRAVRGARLVLDHPAPNAALCELAICAHRAEDPGCEPTATLLNIEEVVGHDQSPARSV